MGRTGARALALLGAVALGHAPVAAAWGRDGHKVIAQIAQSLMTAEEVSRATDILGGDDLASVANWADEVRDEAEWKWTFELHFINTQDGQCNFAYTRDCKDKYGHPDMCVAGALLNYTSQLINSQDKDALQVALKFIIHFAGDIHQPLHVGWTTDEGGNKIPVQESWDPSAHRMNLHEVWDFGIIDGMEAPTHLSEEDIAKNLTQELKTGSMSGSLEAWSHCGDRADKTNLLKCVTQIASESIKDACTYAYKDDQGNLISQGEDLDEAYFATRVPVVRSRLAAGGARLAGILKYALSATSSDRLLFA